MERRLFIGVVSAAALAFGCFVAAAVWAANSDHGPSERELCESEGGTYVVVGVYQPPAVVVGQTAINMPPVLTYECAGER